MTKIRNQIKSYGDRHDTDWDKINPNYVWTSEGLQKTILRKKMNSVIKNLCCIRMEVVQKEGWRKASTIVHYD